MLAARCLVYNQPMKIFLVIAVFLATFAVSFLFWPEFAIKSGGCEYNGNTDPTVGCLAVSYLDYSDWRLHGGITWLERRNICQISGNRCIPLMDEPEPYDTNTPLMFLGSLGIASVVTVASKMILTRHRK